jgi:hypothetical protein
VVRRERDVDDRAAAGRPDGELAASRVISSVPPTFSRVTARQPFGSIASAGTKYWPPALLTSASSRPQRSRAKRTIRSASAGSRTSPATACAPSSAAVRSSTSARRPQITTSAPHARSSAAACAPQAGATAGDEHDAALHETGREDLGHSRRLSPDPT